MPGLVDTFIPCKERAYVDVAAATFLSSCNLPKQLRLAFHKSHPDTLVYLSRCNAGDPLSIASQCACEIRRCGMA